MIYGIGTDLIEVARVAKVCESNPRFVERVFTENEKAYSFKNKKNPYMHLAASWAAKESLYKAVNVRCRYADVEVAHEESGKPFFRFERELAETLAEFTFHLSISHIKDYATAVVVAEARPSKHQLVEITIS